MDSNLNGMSRVPIGKLIRAREAIKFKKAMRLKEYQDWEHKEIEKLLLKKNWLGKLKFPTIEDAKDEIKGNNDINGMAYSEYAFYRHDDSSYDSQINFLNIMIETNKDENNSCYLNFEAAQLVYFNCGHDIYS